RRLASAPFDRVLPLAIIARPIGSDAKQPRLELRIPLKRMQTFDDCQKYFLTHLLDIFPREIGRKLENEPPGGSVMLIEQLIPSLSLALAAAREQFGLWVGSHSRLKSNQQTAFCQPLLNPRPKECPGFASYSSPLPVSALRSQARFARSGAVASTFA